MADLGEECVDLPHIPLAGVRIHDRERLGAAAAAHEVGRRTELLELRLDDRSQQRNPRFLSWITGFVSLEAREPNARFAEGQLRRSEVALVSGEEVPALGRLLGLDVIVEVTDLSKHLDRTPREPRLAPAEVEYHHHRQ